jgi:uncharacterized membrane protein YccC
MEKRPARTRDLAILIAGLIDCIFGGILLLSWLDLLPLDLASFGFTHSLAGIVGAVLAVSGVAVVTYQLTKLRPPD